MPKPALVNTPFVLVIRDGWGENPHPEHDAFNAVKLARTPAAHRLMGEYPNTLIHTSGENVGLPDGTMGNSEVGHQNIGAGRVVDQEAVRISKACREGRLGQAAALSGAIERARKDRRYVHLMGICSDAGVHGLLDHLYALLDLCKKMGQAKVALHLFTDGRDTGPCSGKGFVEQVEQRCREIGVGTVSSVIGRYWAMDRDYRWERVQKAYLCLTGRGGRAADLPVAPSAFEAVQRSYDHPLEGAGQAGMRGDEFVTPTMIGRDHADALSRRIADGDTMVFYNYRGDRPREIVSAFVLPEFFGSEKVKPSPDTGARGFDRGAKLNVEFVTMTAYSEALAPYVKVAFPRPPKMVNIAGEYFSNLGLTQFRCAETEKYPHVTFFFNDYRDEPFTGERRENPQSPRVATYDLKPEMAAYEVRDAVLRRLAAAVPRAHVDVEYAQLDDAGE